MLIDRTHRVWAGMTLIFLIVATVLYWMYARSWPGGPSGRTWPGMLFGIAGTLLMIFAGLFALRKRTVRRRWGSLSWWLKGHIWMGLLSVPLILFHTAFRWGGKLESVLWIAFIVVIVSGLAGLLFQQILPRMMKLQLPEETIPDQFAEVCARLLKAADEAIMKQCKPAVVEAAMSRMSGEPVSAGEDPQGWLADFYVATVRPFLDFKQAGSPLIHSQQAQRTFEHARSTLPYEAHPTVDQLEQLCDRRRQIAQQDRLYRYLHGWLKIHVPFSIGLLVFAIAHIISVMYF